MKPKSIWNTLSASSRRLLAGPIVVCALCSALACVGISCKDDAAYGPAPSDFMEMATTYENLPWMLFLYQDGDKVINRPSDGQFVFVMTPGGLFGNDGVNRYEGSFDGLWDSVTISVSGWDIAGSGSWVPWTVLSGGWKVDNAPELLRLRRGNKMLLFYSTHNASASRFRMAGKKYTITSSSDSLLDSVRSWSSAPKLSVLGDRSFSVSLSDSSASITLVGCYGWDGADGVKLFYAGERSSGALGTKYSQAVDFFKGLVRCTHVSVSDASAALLDSRSGRWYRCHLVAP